MLKKRKLLALIVLSVLSLGATAPAENDAVRLSKLLERVYQTMDDHYYLPVSRQIYDQFVATYTADRLRALNEKTHQTEDFIHLGAGLLVNKLKNPSDRFSNFVPPAKTKAFKQEAYATVEDLGIEGRKIADRFEITKVQKHCKAFSKGIRTLDAILKINGKSVKLLPETDIAKQLQPPVGTKVILLVALKSSGLTQEITLTSQSYFKETVSPIPTDIQGVCILRIVHFNQKTMDDFGDEIAAFGPERIKLLVLDLRDNGGGPPLAAREILGYFLPPNDPLFAIFRKKQKPIMLTAPAKPTHYSGPVRILVNQKTGSAAEMFSGILQAKKIALLVGQQTAGATYLKSMYDFDDGSTLFMITSLTFFYDRRLFPPNGIAPDIALPESEDGLQHVLADFKRS